MKHDEVALPDGQVGLVLSYYTDSNHNYVVEFRDSLVDSSCNQWRPWVHAPHNYGIVFATNSPAQRFFRLRRIAQPRSPLFALLANDTGTNAYDGLTSDPTISGLALEFPVGTVLRGSLDDSKGPYLTIIDLHYPIYFQIDSNKLAEINGGSLPDGPHTLYLKASDPAQNTLATNAVSFVLDTLAPSLTLVLAAQFGSEPIGDRITSNNPVALTGKTEPGLAVELLPSGPIAIADANGDFTFQDVTLAAGENQFTARVLDGACNEAMVSTKVIFSGQQCTFSDGLPGWTVTVTTPSDLVSNTAIMGSAARTPVSGTVNADNCSALMTEGDSFLVTLERGMTLPQTDGSQALSLTFNYTQLGFDQTTSKAMKDSFEVAIVDLQGNSLTYVIADGHDAFFNVSDGQTPVLASGVTSTPPTAGSQASRVSVDLSSLFPGQTFRLIFRLVNNDRDRATAIRITDVSLRTDGGPMVLALGSDLLQQTARTDKTTGAVRRVRHAESSGNDNRVKKSALSAPADFSSLSDVSASVVGDYRYTSFDEHNHTLFADLLIRNAGQYLVRAPFLVEIARISDPSVRLLNADGASLDGIPYLDFTDQLPNSSSQPRAVTGLRTLAFSNPQRVQFTYDLVVVGQLNRGPVVTSVPVREVTVGQNYTYECVATDPDNDSLAYSLTRSPHLNRQPLPAR